MEFSPFAELSGETWNGQSCVDYRLPVNVPADLSSSIAYEGCNLSVEV